MIDKLYRIVDDGSVEPPYNHHDAIREGLALAKEHGVLKPVELCEHGFYDEHPVDLTTDEWCEGATHEGSRR